MIHWKAHFDDSAVLSEQDGAKYADIDRQKIIAFDFWNDDQLIIRIDLRQEQDPDLGPKRLIWRKRHQQDDKGGHRVIHMAGWQRKVKGRNVQSIVYLFDDGTMLLGGQFRTGDFQDAIVVLDFEQDLI